jgi:hypothetical protein
MNLITGDLGPTATYTRREYRWLSGIYADGRDGTLWLEHWNAARRHGTKTTLSRYAVGETKLVGWAGRAFIFDKEFPANEHESTDRNAPQPPYTVRVGRDGEIVCSCMAANCNAPCCRHCDAVMELLDAGELPAQELAGI